MYTAFLLTPASIHTQTRKSRSHSSVRRGGATPRCPGSAGRSGTGT